MKHFSVMMYETLSAIELILIEDIFYWWRKQDFMSKWNIP